MCIILHSYVLCVSKPHPYQSVHPHAHVLHGKGHESQNSSSNFYNSLVLSYLLCTNTLLGTMSHNRNLHYIFTVAEKLKMTQQAALQFHINFNPLADAHISGARLPGD